MVFDRAARNRLTSRLSFRGMTSLFARLVSVLFSGTRFERGGDSVSLLYSSLWKFSPACPLL